MIQWMKQGLAPILLSLAFSVPVMAACEDGYPRRVVDALMNEEPAAADRFIEQWSRADGSNPLVDVHRAMVQVVRAYHAESSAQRRLHEDRALRYSEKVLARDGWNPLEESGGDARTRLARGYALALQAVIHYNRGEERKAYDLGYRGHELLQSLVDSDPSMEDAYFVLGMYEYYLGSIPEEKRSGARLLNMRGDVDQGIAWLERAVARAPVISPEAARVLLVQLGLPDEQLCRYQGLARQMHQRYPGNRLLGLVARLIPLQCRVLAREGRVVAKPSGLRLDQACSRGY